MGTLHNSVYSSVDIHSVVNVISLVSNDLSLDNVAEFQEAQSVVKLIIESTLSIQNLESLAFFTSRNKVVKISKFTDLKSFPEDITFCWFRCIMNSSSVDKRVSVIPDLSFQVCMKLS